MIRTLQRLAVITAGTAIMTAINALAWTITGFALAATVALTVLAIENATNPKRRVHRCGPECRVVPHRDSMPIT